MFSQLTQGLLEGKKKTTKQWFFLFLFFFLMHTQHYVLHYILPVFIDLITWARWNTSGIVLYFFLLSLQNITRHWFSRTGFHVGQTQYPLIFWVQTVHIQELVTCIFISDLCIEPLSSISLWLQWIDLFVFLLLWICDLLYCSCGSIPLPFNLGLWCAEPCLKTNWFTLPKGLRIKIQLRQIICHSVIMLL